MKAVFTHLLLGAFCLCGTQAFAQDAASTLFAQPGTVRAATLAPATLRLPADTRFQINSLSGNLWLHNSAARSHLGTYMLTGATISDADKLEILDNLPAISRISGGMNFTALGAAYQLDNESQMAFSLTVTDRIMAGGQFGDAFLDFMLRGNRHLAGQTVNIAENLALSAQWAREYAVGWATDVPFGGDGDAFKLRFGARAKLLTGHFAGQAEDVRMNIYTHPDGEYLDLDFDYDVYRTRRVKGDGAFKSFGSGFGADVSLAATFQQRLEVAVSLLDVGSMTYNQNVELLRGSGNERYEQLIVGALFWDDKLNQGADEGESQSFPLAPDTLSNQTLAMVLPTRLLLNGSFGVGAAEKNDNGQPYYLHNVSLVACLPLATGSGYFASPSISAAYTYHWRGLLRVGGSLSHTPFYALGIGVFGGIDTGRIQAGVGTENLARLFVNDALGGGDLMLNLAISF